MEISSEKTHLATEQIKHSTRKQLDHFSEGHNFSQNWVRRISFNLLYKVICSPRTCKRHVFLVVWTKLIQILLNFTCYYKKKTHVTFI